MRSPAAGRPWHVLAFVVAVSTALRIWGGTLVPAPWYTPDEMIYGLLGRSLWSSGRLAILGATSPFYSLVYPAFAGLPLSLGDARAGYDLLKALQALAMSLTAVPVYLWGRELTGRGWALVAAVLSLATPALVFSGFVMTEVLFYPTIVLAAWAAARALADPTSRNQLAFVAAGTIAVLTRLQAIVLVPVFLLALALLLFFERARLRSAVRYGPALLGIAGGVAAWLALSVGGSALGAYAVVGRRGYDVAQVIDFGVYHGADVLLLVGAIPVLAFVLVALPSFSRREESRAVRAYVAVATALTLGLVAQVGLFASRYTGRLAERNLIPLAPVLLLGLCVWLARGAPRPRAATLVAAVGIAALAAALPTARFAVEAAIPDAYGIVPLFRLGGRFPELNLRATFVLAVAGALLLAVVVPRRALAVVPVVVGAYLAVSSVVVTRTVAHQARAFWPFMVGDDLRWIDERVDGDTAYLYGGDKLWNRAWYNAFWNRRIDRVYRFGADEVLGPIPQRPVAVDAEGQFNAPATPYVVAPYSFELAGRRLKDEPQAEIALWRVEPPLRLLTWSLGVTATGGLNGDGELRAFGCHGGWFRLTFVSSGERTVTIRRDEAPFRTVTLHGGDVWNARIPAAPAVGGICTLQVSVPGGIYAKEFTFERKPRG